jgi:DNA ligase-1
MLRWRKDKNIDDANTLDDLKELLPKEENVSRTS